MIAHQRYLASPFRPWRAIESCASRAGRRRNSHFQGGGLATNAYRAMSARLTPDRCYMPSRDAALYPNLTRVLHLKVKGRPTTLRCVGVCGLVRHSGDFSYNARRAASQIQLVWATDDDAERNAHAGRTEQDSTPSTIAVVAAEQAAEQVAAAPFEMEAQGRVICYGCAAAEDAVSLLVQNVFRLPSVWADLVRKARTRWSIEARCEGVFFAPHLC